MNTKKFDVVGIGNAIVDILVYKDVNFIKRNNLRFGRMKLISEDEINTIYRSISASTECSGGSVANTIVGVSSLGGKSAFIGKVSNDYFGKLFAEDLEKNDVTFHFSPSNLKSTARSLIFITRGDEENHKVERTMATYLGISVELSEKDIDEELITNSKLVVIEGYLLDSEPARKAVNKAISIAEKNNVEIAITLCDPECVMRHKDDFLKIIKNHAKICLGNFHEVSALLAISDTDEILKSLSTLCPISVMTMSENGSFIVNGKKVYVIDAKATDEVYDVTGAGDLYTSGFLYGYTNGYDLQISGNIAAYCATEVLKYIGARPLKSLKDVTDEVLKDFKK
jgi:sugar/nucleoside kinase (ribokinase family)